MFGPKFEPDRDPEARIDNTTTKKGRGHVEDVRGSLYMGRGMVRTSTDPSVLPVPRGDGFGVRRGRDPGERYPGKGVCLWVGDEDRRRGRMTECTTRFLSGSRGPCRRPWPQNRCPTTESDEVTPGGGGRNNQQKILSEKIKFVEVNGERRVESRVGDTKGQ